MGDIPEMDGCPLELEEQEDGFQVEELVATDEIRGTRSREVCNFKQEFMLLLKEADYESNLMVRGQITSHLQSVFGMKKEKGFGFNRRIGKKTQ